MESAVRGGWALWRGVVVYGCGAGSPIVSRAQGSAEARWASNLLDIVGHCRDVS